MLPEALPTQSPRDATILRTHSLFWSPILALQPTTGSTVAPNAESRRTHDLRTLKHFHKLSLNDLSIQVHGHLGQKYDLGWPLVRSKIFRGVFRDVVRGE